MGLSASSLKSVLSALKTAPKVIDAIQVWKGKPSKADREKLIKYARRLDERRVFYARFDGEVIEACVGSLSFTAKYTDEALTDLEHPGARAVVASILDCIRQFLDRWGGYQTPRHWDMPRGWEMPRPGRDEQEFPEFFKDLGELRGKVKLLVGMLAEFEPTAVAPSLTGDEGDR